MLNSSMNQSQRSQSQHANSMLSSHEKRFLLEEISQEVSRIADEDNLTEASVKRLSEIIDTVESASPNTTDNVDSSAGVCYMHSKALKDTSDLTKRCTEQVTGEVDNYDKFALATHIKSNPDFWDFMFPLEVPPVAYLHGTFAPTPLEQRPRAARRKVERQRAKDVKGPKKVDKQTQEEKTDESTKKVEQMLSFIKRVGKTEPVSYFHLLLHPVNFSRTIENIYHFSFLVRDGCVKVVLDDKFGLPFVTVMSSEKKRRAEDTEFNQFIVTMDMQRWQELVEAFEIREPMMK
ncbi:EP300-interacting inhibitor of differentiation 3 isoform X2 [Bicyclus anynana]|uniref:Non-structural maintenance of chromosomes element 4 n=1 Tax=Bicyclus anynana TaxID=110368 RepID=A0A6J1NT36_BICAN|nr:EP300-interacting inhibitor of differentiation 3 isoform X2 [Bicyclus anynana]XP_052745443.1 EP300-interacting inhibitor of differentiation 3 isoform X2 [Bicyclus anynana]